MLWLSSRSEHMGEVGSTGGEAQLYAIGIPVYVTRPLATIIPSDCTLCFTPTSAVFHCYNIKTF